MMAWNLQKESMNNLVMPGQLIEGHAKYEQDCTQCHVSFDKTSQRDLCLNCHTEVRDDMTAGEGFHGRSPLVADRQCKTCHTDHIGRDADIVGLDRAVFNHDWTDFPLAGAHASKAISCDDCHNGGQKFRAAPRDCVACHREDDAHDGQLGTACADCHQPTAWLDTYFDHDKTDFPLTGLHRDVTCASCHAGNVFKDTPRACVDCHLINDVHDSPVDAQCQTCHNPEGWDGVLFDHNQGTDFKLENKHEQVTCEACHKDLLFQVETGGRCVDCHAAQDVHKGTNGNRCDECHNTAGWADTAFNHDTDTKFPLRGRHTQAQCEGCHKSGSREELPPRNCAGCHSADDVHQGEFTDCSACHNESSWSEDVRFDHDLSAFPLIGMHAAIACEECHVTRAFKSVAKDCRECHAKDDAHKGTLGPRCGDCHNPNDWRLWEFDHDTRTDFPLNGSHRELVCSNCHTEPVQGDFNMPADCNGCHAKDNVHGGKFRALAERCDVCHRETAFTHIKEESIKEFHRRPQDLGISLADNCYSCHVDQDAHHGEFGRRCDRCHGTEAWKELIMGR